MEESTVLQVNTKCLKMGVKMYGKTKGRCEKRIAAESWQSKWNYTQTILPAPPPKNTATTMRTTTTQNRCFDNDQTGHLLLI